MINLRNMAKNLKSWTVNLFIIQIPTLLIFQLRKILRSWCLRLPESWFGSDFTQDGEGIRVDDKTLGGSPEINNLINIFYFSTGLS